MFWELFKTFKVLWAEAAGRALILGFLAIVVTGTVFYMIVEDWSLIDSLYFTVVMLTTVGFGDLHPTTELSRAFTIVFILIGVSFILGFLNFIMNRTVQRRAEEKYHAGIQPQHPGLVLPPPPHQDPPIVEGQGEGS